MTRFLGQSHFFAAAVLSMRLGLAHAAPSVPPNSALQPLASYFKDAISRHAGQVNSVEFCPDNTCEVFVGKKNVPLTTVEDFTYLYVYFFSDYYALAGWRRTPRASAFAKEILARHADSNCKSRRHTEKARCLILQLSAHDEIKIFNDRYDETSRHRQQENIGAAIKRRLRHEWPVARSYSQEYLLPPGWRMPSISEIGSEWRRADATKYAIVNGDFNGDGRADKSMLLLSTRNQGFALFVFLSQDDHTFKPYKLDAKNDRSFFEVTGITKVAPGAYRSACGKGYWACSRDEPPEVTLENDGIEYFRDQSAASYFYWDKRRKKFRRVWISD